MLDGKTYSRMVRGLVAVGLSALFSFASLTSLAAGTLLPAARCATKCCCRKAHATDGPAISGRSCQAQCGTVTLGGTGIAVYAQTRNGTSAPVIAVARRPRSTELFAHLL